MSRTIFVLDAFTNGHEAATAFIQRKGWSPTECEIVFCGTHRKLLKRLSGEASFGVVPVRNSIAGEVTEVTVQLSKLREAGYDLLERDELDLQINHCLLVPQDVADPKDLLGVKSHEKAFQQCGLYLDSVGITPDMRDRADSTGNAAKVVSRLDPDARIGAIAPKAAAAEYGLRVLAENIQDVPVNKTTFVFLENEAIVDPVVVGIVGIKGRFGRMLEGFFIRLGCRVIGSDVEDPDGMTNAQVVAGSKVVIFSVPIEDTPAVIRSVLSGVREDQLLMDVTSIKRPAVEAMLESGAQVVGFHPMFRPEVSFDGQTVVVCPARLIVPHWKTWIVNVLAATGSNIKWSTASEHDGYMEVVQVIPHLANLASAALIVESGVSVEESLAFTSPFYRILLSLMGRLVSQNSGLYAAIVMENPGTLAMLERRIEIEQRLVQMIREKDYTSFEQLFTRVREHFGQKVVAGANELFARILGVLSTLHGKNSVTLEFAEAQSRPGLLEHILGVFSRRKINLTGINSVVLGGQRLQFTISFEQSRSSDGVRRALEEIEGWKDPKATVLG